MTRPSSPQSASRNNSLAISSTKRRSTTHNHPIQTNISLYYLQVKQPCRIYVMVLSLFFSYYGFVSVTSPILIYIYCVVLSIYSIHFTHQIILYSIFGLCRLVSLNDVRVMVVCIYVYLAVKKVVSATFMLSPCYKFGNSFCIQCQLK